MEGKGNCGFQHQQEHHQEKDRGSRQDPVTTQHLTTNCTVSRVSRLVTFFPPSDSTLFVGLLEFCLAPFVLLSHVLLLKVNFLVYTSIHFTIYLSSLGIPLFPFYAENTLWVSSKVGAAPTWLLHSSDPCYLYFNESQIPSVIKCIIILHTSEKAKIFPIKL